MVLASLGPVRISAHDVTPRVDVGERTVRRMLGVLIGAVAADQSLLMPAPGLLGSKGADDV
jgi:hypothetical protein